MSCCGGLWSCLLWGVLVSAVGYMGINAWMNNKSFVFDADAVADVTNTALRATRGEDYERTFAKVEKDLRQLYPNHILPHSQLEWIFVNAGGWMGAMCVLHASVTEYILFFGTAVDTSGHSGRYWANITDTVIAGKFVQWKEGTMKAQVYGPGDTVFHGVGETAAIQWTAPFWAVEYGRGFIPSTLGFAFSDTIFSTNDVYIIYRTVRIYLIALVQEMFQGNF